MVKCITVLDSATYTQRQFAAIVAITKRMRKFDRWDKMEEITRTIVDDAFHKIDQSLADTLLFGLTKRLVQLKSSLIDLKTRITGNKAEGISHRERLNEKTPFIGDVIVRAAAIF